MSAEAELEIGGLTFELGERERRCGIHGDPTRSGRCPACDAEREGT